jgi:hypothetical protein
MNQLSSESKAEAIHMMELLRGKYSTLAEVKHTRDCFGRILTIQGWKGDDRFE